MNEQERKMLEEVVALSRENNTMIRRLVRAQRIAALWRFVYWAVIIGAALVAYFSIQPYLSALMKVYGGEDISKILDGLPR